MFSNWEMSGETWGYWYFAKVFKISNEFIIFDRSPIYILYLNLFNWLQYPYSIYLEYLFTTSICISAIYLFSKKFLNTFSALFAACLCIPFIQIAEPPVQKLALACSIFALLLRFNKVDRNIIMSSYALLLLSYCFRQTYSLLILTFLIYDLYYFYNQRKKYIFQNFIPKLNSDMPLIIVIALLIYFISNQSSSQWNNVWFTDTTWFPTNGKTMKDGGGIQNLNMFYILKTYGTHAGYDFYLTNKIAFNNADTFINAIFANPIIFFEMILHNIKIFIPTLLVHLFNPGINIWIIKVLYKIIIFTSIFYGAFKFSLQKKISNFFIGSIILLLVLLIAEPKERYLIPAIPIFIMASCYYSHLIIKYFEKLSFSFLDIKLINIRYILFNLSFVILYSLLSFSNFYKWEIITQNLFDKINNNDLILLTNKEMSMNKSLKSLKKISSNCKSIMSLESLFLASFLNNNSIHYSVYEIPPFGNLINTNYNGLQIGRVDCVFISKSLEFGVGKGTSVQLRYKNYIKPFINVMLKNGALKHKIPNYGVAYILKNYKNELK